ncbi:DnaJ family domain-containing protein [Ornithinimicrobium sp. W1679]|uniref:DnaJ family domain-containing protein n=1 Tax=unclassified Ornithinimicrobium TaxID=2615080 RepID=UPI003CF9617B
MAQRGAGDGAPWGRAGERPGAPRAEDQLADQGVRRRPPPGDTARAVSGWVDQQIQQAQRQGAFDDLPGAGRRLPDVDVRTDPDWWVRSLVEREKLDLSAALPGVLQLRREKATFPESLLGLPDETAVRARLEDFNERVLADRRRPHVGPHPPPVVGRVDVEAVVGRWRELVAQQASTAPTAPTVPSASTTSSYPVPEPPDDLSRARRRWWRRARR